jgi:hypothetical protein
MGGFSFTSADCAPDVAAPAAKTANPHRPVNTLQPFVFICFLLFFLIWSAIARGIG